MKIEKIPEGYILARKGGNGCELWRTFNGAESFACEAIDELIAERDALRAKIEQMEKQEPVGTAHAMPGAGAFTMACFDVRDIPVGAKLYALPGAQPAPSIPEISDDLIEAIESRAEQSYRRHHGGIRGQQLTPADALSWHIIHATRDVLAAAPEAKACP